MGWKRVGKRRKLPRVKVSTTRGSSAGEGCCEGSGIVLIVGGTQISNETSGSHGDNEYRRLNDIRFVSCVSLG